jgi:hypothetical protein
LAIVSPFEELRPLFLKDEYQPRPQQRNPRGASFFCSAAEHPFESNGAEKGASFEMLIAG